MITNLYYNDKQQAYYSPIPARCKKCDKLNKECYLLLNYSDKRNGLIKNTYETFCYECADSMKMRGDYNQLILVLVGDVSKDCKLVLFKPAGMVAGRLNETVYTVAERQLGCERVNDRTVFADRAQHNMLGDDGLLVGLLESHVRDPCEELGAPELTLLAEPLLDEALLLDYNCRGVVK